MKVQELTHVTLYENMPMEYTDFSYVVKKLKIFRRKTSISLICLLKSIDCWYMLEPPHQCGSDEDTKGTFF